MGWQDIILNFLIGLTGSLIGTLIGYRVAKHYSKQASKELQDLARATSEELRAETDRLRRLIDTTLLALQSMGAKIGRDKSGEPTGGVGFSDSFPTRRVVKGSNPPDPRTEEKDPGDGEDGPRTEY